MTHIPHAEERPWGESRSPHDRDANLRYQFLRTLFRRDDARRPSLLNARNIARLVARQCGLRYISDFDDFARSRQGWPVGRAEGGLTATSANKRRGRRAMGPAAADSAERNLPSLRPGAA